MTSLNSKPSEQTRAAAKLRTALNSALDQLRTRHAMANEVLLLATLCYDVDAVREAFQKGAHANLGWGTERCGVHQLLRQKDLRDHLDEARAILALFQENAFHFRPTDNRGFHLMNSLLRDQIESPLEGIQLLHDIKSPSQGCWATLTEQLLELFPDDHKTLNALHPDPSDRAAYLLCIAAELNKLSISADECCGDGRYVLEHALTPPFFRALFLDLVLQSGADTNRVRLKNEGDLTQSETPLQMALFSHSLDHVSRAGVLSDLLAAGANPQALNTDGDTLLHLLVSQRVFFKYQVDTFFQCFTCLMEATDDRLKFLNTQNHAGDTVLHVAAASISHPAFKEDWDKESHHAVTQKIMVWLVEQGVDVTLKNHQGQTAYSLARLDSAFPLSILSTIEPPYDQRPILSSMMASGETAPPSCPSGPRARVRTELLDDGLIEVSDPSQRHSSARKQSSQDDNPFIYPTLHLKRKRRTYTEEKEEVPSSRRRISKPSF